MYIGALVAHVESSNEARLRTSCGSLTPAEGSPLEHVVIPSDEDAERRTAHSAMLQTTALMGHDTAFGIPD